MATTIRTQGVLYINGKQVENSFSKISKETHKLRRELKKCTVGTTEFQNKAAELRKAEAAFAQVNAKIKATRSEIGKTDSIFGRFANRLGGMPGMFTMFSSVGWALYGLKKTTDELLQIADAITNVEKTSGLATEEVGKLWHEFSELDTRTSKMYLMKIAEIGGRLGIKGKESLREFTAAIDQAYVALGDSFEGGLEAVTTQLGKLKNLFSETKDMEYPEALNRIGSALNELAANGTSSEQNIADFATRIGQLPDALKPAADKVLGLGAAFEESGEDARIAASGYSRFIVQAAENVDAFAYSMNMGVDEAKKLLNTHPEEFFIRFSEGMVGLDATQTAQIFKDLKLNTLEIQKSVGAAGKNGERFREMMQLSSEAMGEATSLTDEFNKKNNNSAAIWTKIGKGIKEFFTDGVIPEFFDWFSQKVGYITGVLGDAGDGLKTFRERLSFLIKLIKVAVFTFTSYRLAIIATSKATEGLIKQTILQNTVEKLRMIQARLMLGLMALRSAAVALFTRGVKAARIEMQAFNTVTKTNPLGLLLGILTTVYFAWREFSKETKKATKALSEQEIQAKALADANKLMADEAVKSTSKYKTAVDPLISLLRDQNTTLNMRKKAYESLVSAYPEFEGTINSEYRATDKLQKIYETLAKRIREAAIARGMQKAYQKAADEAAEAELAEYNAKLAKDEEDRANEKIDAHNKPYLERMEGSAKYGKDISFSDLNAIKETSDKANKDYDDAVIKRKEAFDKLNKIEGLREGQKNAHFEKIKEIDSQIAEYTKAFNAETNTALKKQYSEAIKDFQDQKKVSENAILTLGGASPGATVDKNRTGGDGGGKPNRLLSDEHKAALKAKETAEREAMKARQKLREEEIADMEEGQDKEIAAINFQTEKKVAAIQAATAKLEQEIGTQQQKIEALREAAKNPKLSDSQRQGLQDSINNLQVATGQKQSIIETNGKREVYLEKTKQSQLEIVRHKYELKDIEDAKRASDAKITQKQLEIEKELSSIETLEQAKAQLQGQLSEKELRAITTLEAAKKALREQANEEVLKLQEESLLAQVEMMQQMLPELTGEAAEKMKAQLLALYEALNKVKNALHDNPDNENTDQKQAMESVDILGFSAAQWEETFSNLDTMEGKMAAVGMAFSALGNAAQMYAQHQKNINDRELVKFQRNQDKKKNLLERQLNAGIISQEQYHNQMLTMEAAAEAKKRELALKQAKAEKAARMFSIIGDTAKASAAALPNLPLVAIVAALGAAQLAIVAGQKLPSYHVGGFTGGLGFRDGSGHEVAGAVHANEYVIPEWLLRKPEVANVAEWLETKRQGISSSYEEGGRTATNSSGVQPQQYTRDDTTTIALVQVLHQLSEVLEDIEKNGVDAFVIGDAKNGRQMEKAIKQFKKIQEKNRR